MSRLDRARAVLAALDAGKAVPRSSLQQVTRLNRVRNVLCRNCSAQILLASLPSGKCAPLDRAPDTGHLVIVAGIAVERGPQHEHAPRWTFHRCQKGELR